MRVRRVGRVIRERCRACVRSKKLYASRPIVAATRERPDECELALIPAYHPGPVPERPSGGRLSAPSRNIATQPFVGSERPEQRSLLNPVVFAGIGTYTSFKSGSAATECARRVVPPGLLAVTARIDPVVCRRS